MKSLITLIRKEIKDTLILFDYFLWLLLDPSKFTKINKKEIKKVLIINLGAIGDVLASTPLLPALKKELNCKISFMVKENNKEIFKYNPYISEILTIKKEFKENVKFLKNKKFDLAIVLLPASTRISLMCLFAKIKYRIGCYGGIQKGPSLFFTKRIFPINNKDHVVKKFLSIIKQIGINNKNPKIEIYLSKKEKESVKKKLNKLNVKDYIVIHPGFSAITKHKYPARLWPLDRYAKVIDYLIENYKLKILLTGSPAEKFISEKIKSLVKNKKKVIVCAEKFNFRESFAVINFAKLIIEPSTGAGHCVAVGVKTPVIDLTGSVSPLEWHPWALKKDYRLLYHPEVCTLCERPYCRKKTIECLKAIPVKEVISAIDSILKSSK